MRISDFNAGVATTDESELVLAVQAGLTYKLTLAQANALRQPKSQVLSDLAALDSGVGYPYRDAGGVWALALPPGVGVFDPLGAAATAQANAIAAAAIDATTKANTAEANAIAAAAIDATAKASAALGAALAADGFIPTMRVNSLDSPVAPPPTPHLYIIDASGNVVFNLPAITPAMNGLPYTFKIRAVGVGFSATINRGGATDVIDDQITISLTALFQSVTLVASYDVGGSFWSII